MIREIFWDSLRSLWALWACSVLQLSHVLIYSTDSALLIGAAPESGEGPTSRTRGPEVCARPRAPLFV
jgi:hypothetical protein